MGGGRQHYFILTSVHQSIFTFSEKKNLKSDFFWLDIRRLFGQIFDEPSIMKMARFSTNHQLRKFSKKKKKKVKTDFSWPDFRRTIN